jgi:hypothetical protein
MYEIEHPIQRLDKARAMIETLHSMPEEKFREPIVIPWCGRASVTQLIEVLIHHKAKEHPPDMEQWLENHNQPLLDRH